MSQDSRTHPLYLHFLELPLSVRLVYTGVLLVLGLGYLFSMIYIYTSHAGRDGSPMLSVTDMRLAYRGSDADTRLEAALKSTMKNMVSPEDNVAIFKWVRDGASRSGYDETIAPVFKQRCIACHSGENTHIPKLTTYDEVMSVVRIDEGMTITTLVRVSHIHLLGIAFIFFICGLIFGHAYVRPLWFKWTVVSVPFGALLIDVMSWYLTKVAAGFAWVVIASGFSMAFCFAVMFFVSLYQMWFYKLSDELRSRHRAAVQLID